MPRNIESLKSIVEQGKFPFDHKHFAGTGLIITNDPKYTGYPEDVVICTQHAGALSWLVFELKSIYTNKLDHANKYAFYPLIGDIIKDTFIDEIEKRCE